MPKVKVQDAVKQIITLVKKSTLWEKKNNLFLTQTPQAFNLKEIFHLHKNNSDKYKDDDISLYGS